MSELGIKGVYQLQGGIDKYFKNFPSGGQFIYIFCAVRMIHCLTNTIFDAAAVSFLDLLSQDIGMEKTTYSTKGFLIIPK